jgi:hypothetical protein
MKETEMKEMHDDGNERGMESKRSWLLREGGIKFNRGCHNLM